jgi:hypothetical protein
VEVLKYPWVARLADDLSDPIVIAATASEELRLSNNPGDSHAAWLESKSDRHGSSGDHSQELAAAEHYLWGRSQVEANSYLWGTFYILVPGYSAAKSILPLSWFGPYTTEPSWEQFTAGITGANDGLFGESIECMRPCRTGGGN